MDDDVIAPSSSAFAPGPVPWAGGATKGSGGVDASESTVGGACSCVGCVSGVCVVDGGLLGVVGLGAAFGDGEGVEATGASFGALSFSAELAGVKGVVSESSVDAGEIVGALFGGVSANAIPDGCPIAAQSIQAVDFWRARRNMRRTPICKPRWQESPVMMARIIAAEIEDCGADRSDNPTAMFRAAARAEQ